MIYLRTYKQPEVRKDRTNITNETDWFVGLSRIPQETPDCSVPMRWAMIQTDIEFEIIITFEIQIESNK